MGANRFDWALGGLALTAPYFGLRVAGTSYSLVDIIISVTVVSRLGWLCIRPHTSVKLLKRAGSTMAVGLVFAFFGLLSGLEAQILGAGEFSAPKLLSAVVQYAFVMIALPMVAAYHLPVDRVWRFLRLIALGYMVPMVFTVVLLHPVFPEAMRDVFFSAGRAIGTFENANSFAAVLTILIPIYGVFMITEHGWWRGIGLAGFLLAVLCLTLTASIGGMVSLGLVLAANLLWVLVWRRHPIRIYFGRTVVVTVVMLIVMVLLSVLLSSYFIHDHGRVQDRFQLLAQWWQVGIIDFGSVSLRFELIKEAWGLIIERFGGLIWGHGLGQSKVVSAYQISVHLQYLLLWVEGGMALLLIYIGFLGVLLRNAFRLASIHPAAGVAVGLGIVAIALFGFFNPHIYLRYFWIPVLPALVVWPRKRRE